MGKVRKFNYANDTDFAEVLQRYGGEKYLKEKYPRILQMLNDSRVYHQLLEHEKSIKKSSEMEDGREDDFGIALLPVNSSNVTQKMAEEKNVLPTSCGVYSASHVSLKDKHSLIMMSGTIHDPVAGKSFASFSLFEPEAQKLKDEQMVDYRYLGYTSQPIVKAETSFTVYDTINNKSVCAMDVIDDRIISIKNMKPTVNAIDVLQPCSKNATDTDIRIVYNGREDNQAAYNFKKAKKEGSIVNVFFPFHIQVTLDEVFEFNPKEPTENLKDAYIRLASSVVLGGAVHFDYYHRENIKIEVHGNILDVNFEYIPDEKENYSNTDKNYWGRNMTLGANETNGYFDFHLNFTVNYGIKGSGIYDQKTDIIVSSEQLPASSNFVKIKTSKIIWGCLGKDTMIRTENGYSRIDEIKLGEKIFTDRGFIEVTNIITGIEEKIVAVRGDNGKTLLITSEHPIACERGVIRAIDLLATDRLRIEDNTYESINYLEVIDYSDKIYSLELEEPALISANGIMVGDYMMPAQGVAVNKKECTLLDFKLIEELKKWQTVNQNIKNEISL